MQEAHKLTKLEVGKYYLVPVAFCASWKGNEVIPIFPLLHKDKQFGVDWFHYHIDGRFAMKLSVHRKQSFIDGKTNTILTKDEVVNVKLMKKKCLREETGIIPPKGISRYSLWYESYIGKSCKGKKCPHYGQLMREVGDKLICPLHNLIADAKTEKIIHYQEVA